MQHYICNKMITTDRSKPQTLWYGL